VLDGDVVRTAGAAGGELLERVDVFDRYVGDPIPAGHHSLALRLTFRAADRTLTDAEVAEVRGAIAGALAADHAAELRS
jgi:phenylalanyl-tRNA synthetase beta chain